MIYKGCGGLYIHIFTSHCFLMVQKSLESYLPEIASEVSELSHWTIDHAQFKIRFVKPKQLYQKLMELFPKESPPDGWTKTSEYISCQMDAGLYEPSEDVFYYNPDVIGRGTSNFGYRTLFAYGMFTRQQHIAHPHIKELYDLKNQRMLIIDFIKADADFFSNVYADKYAKGEIPQPTFMAGTLSLLTFFLSAGGIFRRRPKITEKQFERLHARIGREGINYLYGTNAVDLEENLDLLADQDYMFQILSKMQDAGY